MSYTEQQKRRAAKALARKSSISYTSALKNITAHGVLHYANLIGSQASWDVAGNDIVSSTSDTVSTVSTSDITFSFSNVSHSTPCDFGA